jgi:light-regulated signal transduction histidine kinase (bacteriophytochrome)
MQKYIDDLLLLSKSNSKPESFESFEIKEVILEIVENLEKQIRNSKGTINIENIPKVEGNREQIKLVFQCLISNSLKFNKDTVPPVININSIYNQESHKWEISIQDNGIGFDDKHLNRMFKPFQRLNGYSAYEGTGVGLAVCERILASHFGEITAKSSPENGATFIISLPEKQPSK